MPSRHLKSAIRPVIENGNALHMHTGLTLNTDKQTETVAQLCALSVKLNVHRDMIRPCAT